MVPLDDDYKACSDSGVPSSQGICCPPACLSCSRLVHRVRCLLTRACTCSPAPSPRCSQRTSYRKRSWSTHRPTRSSSLANRPSEVLCRSCSSSINYTTLNSARVHSLSITENVCLFRLSCETTVRQLLFPALLLCDYHETAGMTAARPDDRAPAGRPTIFRVSAARTSPCGTTTGSLAPYQSHFGCCAIYVLQSHMCPGMQLARVEYRTESTDHLSDAMYHCI